MHRPGKKNHVIDVVSWREHCKVLGALLGPSWRVWDEIRKEIKFDLKCKDVIENLE